AIDLFFHYHYVPEPRTPLKAVRKLPAGHSLTVQVEPWRVEQRPYWSLLEVPTVEGDPVELIRAELEKIGELIIRSDVPVGVALSGGMDSGAIAAFSAKQCREQMHAFSVGYSGRPQQDEREKAARLARQMGLKFTDVELRTDRLVESFQDLVVNMDDPVGDIAAFGFFSVMNLAHEHGIKVMLCGLGGDELFWGYEWMRRAVELTEMKRDLLLSKKVPWWARLDLLKKVVEHPLYGRLSRSNKMPGFGQSFLEHVAKMKQLTLGYPNQAVFQELLPDFGAAFLHRERLFEPAFLEQVPARNPFSSFEMSLDESVHIPIQLCKSIFDTWQVSNCLVLGDRLSMACSVEGRVPLLDYRLVELVFGLRRSRPDHRLGYKVWFKEALKGILPDELLNRRKQGFQPPVGEWIDGVVGRYAHLLDQGSLVGLGILAKNWRKKLITQSHGFGHPNFVLFKLITLEIWYRNVVCHPSQSNLP
ncbi:MAG: asparagine synthetase B family protein, partial [Pseudomonadota bacterium]